MEKITAYLCSKTAEAIGYEPFDGDIGSIEVSAGKVTAQLWPEVSTPGCRTSAGKVKAKLLEIDGTPYCQEGGGLSWEREEIPCQGALIGLEDYITIKVDSPDNCRWVGSIIKARGADDSLFGRTFALVTPGTSGQDCPDDKNDVFSGGDVSSFIMIQNQIVPGETIELRWIFWDGQHTEETFVDAEKFCTCCFTGGKVKTVNGEYGDVSISYMVEIYGVDTLCVSSDFVEYAVGDWVFVFAANSFCAECGRKVACKSACEERSDSPGDKGILLSLVNNERAVFGLQPLCGNSKLDTAALRHAEDMAENHFHSHEGSDGSTPGSRIADSGYLDEGEVTGAGENVGMGYKTIHDMFNGWMNSPGHYAQIVHPTYREMGFAVEGDEGDEGGKKWCQTFGYNDSHTPQEEGLVSAYMIMPLKVGSYGS